LVAIRSRQFAPLPTVRCIEQRNAKPEPAMFVKPVTFRIVSAVLSVAIGSTLLLAKAHFSNEYRVATRGDAIVLPVGEVIGDRAAASMAAAPTGVRVN